MYGGFDAQQLLGQNAGYFGSQGFGQANTGYFGGQGFGQANTGYFGGQGFGQANTGYFGGQGVDVTASYFGAQATTGPTTSQGSSVQRSVETTHVTQQVSSSVGERQQRQANKTSSSSDVSSDEKKAPPKATITATQQSGGSSSSTHVIGGHSGASFDASGASIGSAVAGQRRQARHRQEVIRLPDQPQGPARQVRHRMPTPEPDTIERVYLQRTAGEIVEEIIEVPTTPPPRIQEKTVVEPAGPPQVIKKVIRVPPRSGGQGYQQQTGSFSNMQQAAAGTSYSAGFTAPVGGFQQQSFGFGGFSSQAAPAAAAPTGAFPANCFYV